MLHILHFYTFLRGTSWKLITVLLLAGMLTVPVFPAQAAPPNPRLVKDINPGLASSYDDPYYPAENSFVVMNGILYFEADDSVHGRELWRSDGTAAGTFLVKDITPGPGESDLWNLLNVNNTLFFNPDDGIHGRELWKSDGTAAGTVLLRDLQPDPSHWPWTMLNVNGTLFYVDWDSQGRELWKSDGTAAGTMLVKDINLGPDSSEANQFTNVNGSLFFAASDGINGEGLWQSDGTTAGTMMVKNISPWRLTAVDKTLFFRADDGSRGEELWKSDGTAAGTMRVKDINPGPFGSYPWPLADGNGLLFFGAEDTVADRNEFGNRELWRSDGTEAGTIMLKDIWLGRRSSNPWQFTPVSDTVFFTAQARNYGEELWLSNGTQSGTIMVKDIYPFYKSALPKDLMNIDGTLFFSAVNKYGRELWKSDGTSAGTLLVKDIYAGGASSDPSPVTNANGTLYFSALTKKGRELWKSDGTKAGTMLVADIAPGHTGSFPHELVVANNQLFFVADDGVHGQEWWVLDLTKPITGLADEAMLAAADAEILEESISDAEAEAVYQAELAAYKAELAQADERVTDAEALPQKVFLPLIAR